jgi:hypothetical protein
MGYLRYVLLLLTCYLADRTDPNNALFVTLAGIVITARYNDRIGEEVRTALRRAMWMAVEGDARRVGGVKDDNLFPAYSNVSY